MTKSKMSIVVKDGRVVKWDCKGSVSEQLRNLEAVISAYQRTAYTMRRVADKATGTDPVLTAENDILKETLKSAEAHGKAQKRAIEAADRQLKEKRGSNA